MRAARKTYEWNHSRTPAGVTEAVREVLKTSQSALTAGEVVGRVQAMGVHASDLRLAVYATLGRLARCRDVRTRNVKE